MSTEDVLADVGPRLRRIRKEREVTLAELSAATGISVSTLSRLESGLRKPSLDLGHVRREPRGRFHLRQAHEAWPV